MSSSRRQKGALSSSSGCPRHRALDYRLVQSFSCGYPYDQALLTYRLEDPRQRECQRGLGAGQYSLGKWMTLLVKYRVISSSGKSVCSISLVKTMLLLPSSHVSVAVRSGRTASFQT